MSLVLVASVGSVITLIHTKHIMLFLSGFFFGVLLTSLVVAYFICRAIPVKLKDDEIQIIYDKEKDKILWNRKGNYSEALEAFWNIAKWHFTGQKSTIITHTRKKSKRIMYTCLTLLAVLALLASYLCFEPELIQKTIDID